MILSTIKDNFDALLISLVLNVNVLRIFMGIQDTNMLLYLIYVLATVTLFIKYHRNIISTIKKRGVKKVYIFVLVIIFYSMISLLWATYDTAVTTFFKFSVALVLSFLCLFVPYYKIRIIGVLFISINVIYSLFCLLMLDRVYSLLGDGMNYLNATLTLGFSFSISLVSFVWAIFNKKRIHMIWWLLLSALFLTSLLSFVARGVLIFPPLITLLMIPVMGRRHVGKTLVVLCIALVIGYVAIQYFMDMTSEYGASRMLRLFEDAEEEDRFELWQQCTSIMLKKYWFLFGGGLCAFSSAIYYPHNIFLQILGEFGIIPFGIFIYMLIMLFKFFFRLNKWTGAGTKWSVFFVIVGIIYYLLTFSKSFSLYDALPLFIMMALMYSFYLGYKGEINNRKYETKDNIILS